MQLAWFSQQSQYTCRSLPSLKHLSNTPPAVPSVRSSSPCRSAWPLSSESVHPVGRTSETVLKLGQSSARSYQEYARRPRFVCQPNPLHQPPLPLPSLWSHGQRFPAIPESHPFGGKFRSLFAVTWKPHGCIAISGGIFLNMALVVRHRDGNFGR